MPGLDRTGPTGKGPRTGRGRGPCSDSLEDKKKNQEETLGRLGLGRRRRRGARGRGRGRGPTDDTD